MNRNRERISSNERTSSCLFSEGLLNEAGPPTLKNVPTRVTRRGTTQWSNACSPPPVDIESWNRRYRFVRSGRQARMLYARQQIGSWCEQRDAGVASKAGEGASGPAASLTFNRSLPLSKISSSVPVRAAKIAQPIRAGPCGLDRVTQLARNGSEICSISFAFGNRPPYIVLFTYRWPAVRVGACAGCDSSIACPRTGSNG
jgi:hypothetical protein